MDLKELSETVQQQQQQQQQGAPVALTTPKKLISSLEKTIESCKAQLGTYSPLTVHAMLCCLLLMIPTPITKISNNFKENKVAGEENEFTVVF